MGPLWDPKYPPFGPQMGVPGGCATGYWRGLQHPQGVVYDGRPSSGWMEIPIQTQKRRDIYPIWTTPGPQDGVPPGVPISAISVILAILAILALLAKATWFIDPPFWTPKRGPK